MKLAVFKDDSADKVSVFKIVRPSLTGRDHLFLGKGIDHNPIRHRLQAIERLDNPIPLVKADGVVRSRDLVVFQVPALRSYSRGNTIKEHVFHKLTPTRSASQALPLLP